MDVITIANVTKAFGKTEALRGVSLSVKEGEIFGFLGPNGAGKSTTIRCLMDFIRADSGELKILGKDVHDDAVALKKDIGYVPAEPVLYDSWTVDAHIKFVANDKTMLDHAQTLKKTLELEGAKKVSQLSTGNTQKLAIVLALMTQPRLLILDEPTRGLDPLLRATFHTLLKDYQKNGGTILLSSHDLSEVEELCTRVAIIHKGQLVQDTTVAELRSKHGHVVRASFKEKTPKLDDLKDVENLVRSDHTLSYTIKGNLGPTLKLLAAHTPEELEVTSASLEDIFVEIYK